MSLLYHNDGRTVYLIDIPTSISDAQHTPSSRSGKLLISSAPLKEPFQVLNEPKNPSRRETFTDTAEETFHSQVRHLIQDGLREIKEHYKGDWCLPRVYVNEVGVASASRKRKAVSDEGQNGCGESAHCGLKQNGDATNSWDTAALHSLDLTVQASKGLRSFFINAGQSALELSVISNPDDTSTLHHVPPGSALISSNIEDSRDMFNLATARHLLSQTKSAGSQEFDLILLDPPWPNASARRARSYGTPRTIEHVRDLVLQIDVQDYLAPGGLIGVWITNRPKFRDLVLGEMSTEHDKDDPARQFADNNVSGIASSLFESWDVMLIEEWIWIKTTTTGEPVTDLESAWRKPYEVLLLGRKRSSTFHGITNEAGIKRRIIAGVPDLHSRKPSLKGLIEPYMPDPRDYRALEVFARHLTAGWWAWGNEVLKFNDVRCWREKDAM